ncbi:MAG: hypothetical protein ACLSVQ_05385 [Faecalibacterium sp.]
MKKWLIGCLTVLAMVCLIPGIALNAKAESLYCRYCDKFTDCEILGYEKFDSSFHTLHIKCKSCSKENDIIDARYSEHTDDGKTPTCTTGKTCALCGAEYGVLGHDWDRWTPNYASNGTHTRRCKRCNAEETGSCSGGYATCDTLGMCNTCGGSYYGGHAWGEWSSAGNGTHTRSCTNYCREVDTAKCTGGKATCTTKAVCEVCDTEYGEKDPNNHDLVHFRAKAPTCTEKGWNAYETCSRCDYTTYTELTALNHDLVQHEAQAATCTKPGWNAYDTCSRCDYTTYAELPALNHDLVNHDAQAATCTEKGWDAYDTCSRCDYTTYAEQPALNHDLKQHAAKAPTCTEKGWNAFDTCNNCNYTTYAELSALNHDYQAVTVEPTCETDGYTVFTCSRCKDSYTADPTDKLGHQFGAWSPNGTGAQSADCLRQGCAHTGSTDCRKFTFRTAEGETLTFCPVCGQAENAAQLEKIDAATAWTISGSLSAEDVTARTNGEYLSVAFETAGSLTQPTGRVRLALPAKLLEGKKLVRIAPDGTQTELPFEAKNGKLIFTLDFANSELPVMLFRLLPQTAAL